MLLVKSHMNISFGTFVQVLPGSQPWPAFLSSLHINHIVIAPVQCQMSHWLSAESAGIYKTPFHIVLIYIQESQNVQEDGMGAEKTLCMLQVTANQLAQQKEAELRQRESATKEAAKARQRVVSEDQYSQLVEGENLNRDDDSVEARSVTQAISALELDANTAGDAHPEKCACCLPQHAPSSTPALANHHLLSALSTLDAHSHALLWSPLH